MKVEDDVRDRSDAQELCAIFCWSEKRAKVKRKESFVEAKRKAKDVFEKKRRKLVVTRSHRIQWVQSRRILTTLPTSDDTLIFRIFLFHLIRMRATIFHLQCSHRHCHRSEIAFHILRLKMFRLMESRLISIHLLSFLLCHDCRTTIIRFWLSNEMKMMNKKGEDERSKNASFRRSFLSF